MIMLIRIRELAFQIWDNAFQKDGYWQEGFALNVFLSIKYHPDSSNRKKIEQILAILESCGAHTFCIARDIEKWGALHFDPQELMRITLREIRNMHLVVVDLAEKGVGIGIEGGYAVGRGIQVVTIAPLGSDISLTLAGISSEVFYYKDIEDLKPLFQSLVAG